MKHLLLLTLFTFTFLLAQVYDKSFYARASNDIYHLDQPLIESYKNKGFAVGSIQVDGVPVVFLRNKQSQHLIIRGTYSLRNWTTNAKVTGVAYPYAKGALVHSGYYKTAKDIVKKIQKHLYKNVPIGITGHSLGGAIALLVSLELQQKGYKVKTYTFGMPAVGNKAFVEYAKKLNHKRYVHFLDIIPNMNGDNLKTLQKLTKNVSSKYEFLTVMLKTIQEAPKYFVQDDNQITLYYINAPKQDILADPWMMPAYYHLAINYADVLDPKGKK